MDNPINFIWDRVSKALDALEGKLETKIQEAKTEAKIEALELMRDAIDAKIAKLKAGE